MSQKRTYIQDILYDQIELNDVIVAFIDTIYFKRLKNIKKLGLVHQVYPSANHTFFEHSLGCCHLAKYYMDILISKNVKIDDKDYLAVQIAALCANLGQGPFATAYEAFSHEFNPDENIYKRNLKVFNELVSKNQLIMDKIKQYQLEEKHLKFIRLIIGDKFMSNDYPEKIEIELKNIDYEKTKTFLIEIVNHFNYFDVVKIDSVLRDLKYLGFSSNFSHKRFFEKTSVTNIDELYRLCYRDNLVLNIKELFNSNKFLYYVVYNHLVVFPNNKMIIDCFKIIKDQLLHIDFLEQDDFIFEKILFNRSDLNEDEKKMKSIYYDILERRLYKTIGWLTLFDNSIIEDQNSLNDKKQRANNLKQEFFKDIGGENLDLDGEIVSIAPENTFSTQNVFFYNKINDKLSNLSKADEQIIKSDSSQLIFIVYSKNKEKNRNVLEDWISKFQNFKLKYQLTFYNSHLMNNFKDIRLISNGSYGIVYSANKTFENLNVAIKEIDVTHKNEQEINQIKGEIDRIIKLNDSKYVIKYYNSWEEKPTQFWKTNFNMKNSLHDHTISFNSSVTNQSDQKLTSKSLLNELHFIYIQMELCDKTLYTWIKENLKPFYSQDHQANIDQLNEQKVNLISSLIDGLIEIHNKGIIHSDINPSNILIKSSGENKIKIKYADFGVNQLGTIQYRSQDQSTTKKGSKKADLFSLGVTIFKILNGEIGLDIKNFRLTLFPNLPEEINDEETTHYYESIKQFTSLFLDDAINEENSFERLNSIKSYFESTFRSKILNFKINF